MSRKYVIIGLGVFVILNGLLLFFNLSHKRHTTESVGQQRDLIDSVKNVNVFNEQSVVPIQKLIGDTPRILLRFPPYTCPCLEPDFIEAIHSLKNAVHEDKIIAVVAAANAKDLLFFRERNRLSCMVYATADTLIVSIDTKEKPYACIVSPDRSVRNLTAINPDKISELISVYNALK